jgi:hypothetical protein
MLKIHKNILLFPTISHMNKSKQYHRVKYFVLPIVRNILGYFFEFLSFILPNFIKRIIDNRYHNNFKITNFLSYNLFQNITFLASSEFKLVKDLDNCLINENNTYCYFGLNDHWVPEGVIENLQSNFKNLNLYVDDKSNHAFVVYENDIKRVINNLFELKYI